MDPLILERIRTNDSTLTTLVDLSRNMIGDQGATALAQALQHNTSLTNLRLSYNQIRAQTRHTLKESRGKLRSGHSHLSKLLTDESSLISTLPCDMTLINEIIRLADASIPDCDILF